MLAEGLWCKGSWDGLLTWEQSLVSCSGCRQEHVRPGLCKGAARDQESTLDCVFGTCVLRSSV